MKNLMLLFSFVLFAGFASAQEATVAKKSCAKTCTAAQKAACAKKGMTCSASCAKSCCASKTASAEGMDKVVVNPVDTEVLAAYAAADLAAEKDETISRKECSASGKVSYYQKSVCATSGAEKMTEVKYCTKSAAFVSADSAVEKKSCSKTCTGSKKKACSASKNASASVAAPTSAEGMNKVVVNPVDTEVLAAYAAAELAAENDETISRKECSVSGKVSYYQKSVCAKSGAEKMTEVKYCPHAEAFVNAAPSDVMNAGDAKAIKTANTVDGAVQKSTTGAKKKCCKGKKKCSSAKAGA